MVNVTRPENSEYHLHRLYNFRTPTGTVRLYSKPGIYSWERPDRSAWLLMQALKRDALPAGARVLDLGCGNGVVGLSLLNLQPDLQLHFVDCSFAAYTAVSLSLSRLGYPGKAWFSDITGEIPPEQRYDVIACSLPRGRAVAEQFLREAWQRLEIGGRLYIAGSKDTGIRTRIETMTKWFGDVDVLAVVPNYRVAGVVKRAGVNLPGSDYHQWQEAQFTLGEREWHYITKPGVFSFGDLDAGTERLLQNLTVRPGERLLDIGCGAGIIGTVAASFADDVNVTMVDDSFLAVHAAERTAALNGMAATVLPSDCGGAAIGEHYDIVVANPPFHLGQAVEYDVATQFIEDARDILEVKGRLCLVCNSFLPYEQQMQKMFRRVETLYKDGRFKVLLAARPLGRVKKRLKPPLVQE